MAYIWPNHPHNPLIVYPYHTPQARPGIRFSYIMRYALCTHFAYTQFMSEHTQILGQKRMFIPRPAIRITFSLSEPYYHVHGSRIWSKRERDTEIPRAYRHDAGLSSSVFSSTSFVVHISWNRAYRMFSSISKMYNMWRKENK